MVPDKRVYPKKMLRHSNQHLFFLKIAFIDSYYHVQEEVCSSILEKPLPQLFIAWTEMLLVHRVHRLEEILEIITALPGDLQTKNCQQFRDRTQIHDQVKH